MARSSSPKISCVDVGAAGRIAEAPRRSKRAHFCKLCGRKLCSYHVDSKYCYAHEPEGQEIEDKIKQDKDNAKFRAAYHKKQKLLKERKQNESKNNINRSTKGSCV